MQKKNTEVLALAKCASDLQYVWRCQPGTYLKVLQAPLCLQTRVEVDAGAGHILCFTNIAPNTSSVTMAEQHMSHDQVRMTPHFIEFNLFKRLT